MLHLCSKKSLAICELSFVLLRFLALVTDRHLAYEVRLSINLFLNSIAAGTETMIGNHT